MSGAFTWAKGLAYKPLTMALSQRLDLRQTQALVMTPQLQQAIKLLQLSSIELTVFVERELEQNPLLEIDDSDHEGRDTATSADPVPEPAPPVSNQTASLDGGEPMIAGEDIDQWH